jgi:hypothetical protein
MGHVFVNAINGGMDGEKYWDGTLFQVAPESVGSEHEEPFTPITTN